MKNRVYFTVIIITAFVSFLTTDINSCSAQSNIFFKKYESNISDEKIKTVILHKEGSALTLPVINLNSGERLELHFDDLSTLQRTFSYTMIHCNARWEPSPLEQQEYLDGFGSGRIENTVHSFNTTCDYFHYSLVFPAEDVSPRISGNYALIVYQNNDPENVVLIRQFYVTEKLVTMEATVRQPTGEKYSTGQEIEFTVKYEGYAILDPASDIQIIIRQNGDSQTDFKITNPRFVGPTEINYGGNDGIVFDGGNEFRFFDIKSMKYEAENILRIDFQNPYYHVFLKPDEPRDHEPYFTRKELNGEYFVEKEGSQNKYTEADYVFVHFQMPAQVPYPDGEIYIYGGLSDWSVRNDYRLSFNPEEHQYGTAILLKQGYYNYRYAYCPKGSSTIDRGLLEGNHYETENEYTFFVYHYDTSWNYDRLIAVKQIRSK
jgi:hypothetical protein